MLKLNTRLLGAILAAMGLGLRAPALAQFEVSPDHFTENAQEQAQSQANKHAESSNARIAQLQSDLDGYQWQIKQRASAVEAARRLANGAGGEGEFAPLFIEEYIQRDHELKQLQQDLAPLIRMAQSKLSQITSDLAATAPPKHTPTPQKKQLTVSVSRPQARQQHQLAAFARR